MIFFSILNAKSSICQLYHDENKLQRRAKNIRHCNCFTTCYFIQNHNFSSMYFKANNCSILIIVLIDKTRVISYKYNKVYSLISAKFYNVINLRVHKLNTQLVFERQEHNTMVELLNTSDRSLCLKSVWQKNYLKITTEDYMHFCFCGSTFY
jgi:hypothetical protein